MQTIEDMRWEWIRFETLLRNIDAGLTDSESQAPDDPRARDALREWSGKVGDWRQQLDALLQRYPLSTSAGETTERRTVTMGASVLRR